MEVPNLGSSNGYWSDTAQDVEILIICDSVLRVLRRDWAI